MVVQQCPLHWLHIPIGGAVFTKDVTRIKMGAPTAIDTGVL